MVELLRLLGDKHRELKTQMDNAAMPLMRTSIKDAQKMGWAEISRPITQPAPKNSYEDPAINPLLLPKSMLDKNLVKKL